LVLVVACLAVGTAPAVAGKGDDAAGTYEILVCKDTCAFTNPDKVAVKGILVLTPTVLDLALINQLTDEAFEVAETRRGDPNACFVLDTVENDWTLAGLIPFGVTIWSVDRKKLHFSLYGSPDAFHVVSAKLTSDGFRGYGGDAGYGALEPDERSDFIIARRTGPPDLTKCINGANERHQ
jgi:hypothetical protein